MGLRRRMMGALMLPGRRHWHRVESLARDPDAAQQAALRRVLHANRDTRFGREHGFASIRDPAGYRAQVPVQTYETLRPYVDDQRRTGARALTSEAPLFYAQTSGTTAAPKYIPVTPSMLEFHRAEQALFSYLQFRVCPEAFDGRALGIMGAAVEDRLDSGHPVGSVSGHLYKLLPGLVRSRLVVPPDVLDIADYDLRYLVMLRLALERTDISYLGSPNPSTFLRLLALLERHREALTRSVATGRFELPPDLPHAIRSAVSRRLSARPARAAALEAMPALTFASVWPGIRLVTTWTGGSCGVALGAVRRTLPEAASVMELGYQSSEFRGTVALDLETGAGLPLLDHHALEFVEREAWEEGRPRFLGLHEIEAGPLYYVIVTTAAGLYRYFMNDLVLVDGTLHRTPLLRFAQKGKGVTNLTGEKLYEAQALEAVAHVAARLSLPLRFFVLVADEAAQAYILFVEADGADGPPPAAMADGVDQRLGALNLEYESKRRSGRLGALAVRRLRRGTADAFRAAAVRGGQREAQFKPPALALRRSLPLDLDGYVAD
jgi:hypothetical protein